MRFARKLAVLGILGVFAALALMTMQHPGSGSDVASAASGCYDIDGDGQVEAIDGVIVGDYFATTVPPSPPQVDVNKSTTVIASDFFAVFAAFESTTSCQTSPLSISSQSGGALAVDSNGENATVGDPIQTTRNVTVGDAFRISIQLSANPGSIAGYQARLIWDDPILDFSPRTLAGDDVFAENSGLAVAVLNQIVGAASIELGAVRPTAPGSTGYTGPLAQLEFVCVAPGTANLILTAPGNHTALVAHPATEYTPTLASAQIDCLPDDDGDGCSNAAEQQTAPGSELSGGLRDDLDPNDYFNPSGDGQNRVDDILLVVQAYFDDDDDGNPGLPPYEPGYNPATDRSNMAGSPNRGTRALRTACSACRTSCIR